MPYPETLKAKPKCIFFTDFDGTITLHDSEFPEQPHLTALLTSAQAMTGW